MIGRRIQVVWGLTKESVNGYIEDGALSRGAAIAYYTVTSIAPIIIIVIAVAGLVFGQDAARGAIGDELGGLMGHDGASVLQDIVRNAKNPNASSLAGILGLVTLLATASGTFGEMQSALNAIWRAKPRDTTVSRLVKARIRSLGLVVTIGFLLLVSLVASASITAVSGLLNHLLPFSAFFLRLANLAISFVLIAALFAAIYKTLPDVTLEWRDVLVGSAVTSLLFTIGKFLIGAYLGSSSMGSSYGAAGGLIVLFAWVYYSAQIFLLGAEFTRAYANRHGSLQSTAPAAPL